MSHNIKKEAADEGESVAEEKQEYAKDGDKSEGVSVPEDFQKAVHAVMTKATSKHHVSHVRDMVNAKEDAMRKAEMASKGTSKNGTPAEYSTDGMPSN